MRESRSSGSVEGVMSNRDPYSDYACWAWADVGIVTAINPAMDAAVATRLRKLRAFHSSI
jgi:hypothetical protein